MKSYVITIDYIEQSVQSAKRTIETAKSVSNLDVEMFSAITPKNSLHRIKAEAEGIPFWGFSEVYSRFERCLSAFMSHHALWKRSVELNEDVLIFEHDAVIVSPIPTTTSFKGVLNLGKPSYGKYNTPELFGLNQLQSKNYFGGAHAYIVRPQAAKVLISSAKTKAAPTDLFFSNSNFNFLEEYYPWPVEAHDTFTTIQNTYGCIAKHNHSSKYEII